MTNIVASILAHRGKHPGRLAMHPHTLYDMCCEPEYFRANEHHNSIDRKFFSTSIRTDAKLPRNMVIFERHCARCQFPAYPNVVEAVPDTISFFQRNRKCPKCDGKKYVETHRITVETEGDYT